MEERERKWRRLARVLRRKEARYRRLLESTAEAVYEVDLEGRCTFANPACAALLDYSDPAFLIGRNMHELVHHSRADRSPYPRVDCAMHSPDGRALSPVQEETFWRADGQSFPAECRTSLLRDGDGVLGAVISFRDVTELRLTQQAAERRSALAAFSSDIGLNLTRGGSVKETLAACTDAIVWHLGAAVARLWTYDPREQVLEVQASAGLDAHLRVTHDRVPLGKLEIGIIAAARRPHLTNDVVNDPKFGDREWVRREGLVAFAGYPLVVEDQLVGVMALFSRQPLDDFTFEALAGAADSIALFLERKTNESSLHAVEEQLRIAQKLEAVGQLAAGIAHEINTPMQYVGDSVHFLRDGFGSLIETIGVYQDGCRRLAELPGNEDFAGRVAEAEEAAAIDYLQDRIPRAFERTLEGIDRVSSIVRAMKEFAHPDRREKSPADINRGILNSLTVARNEYKYVAEAETELDELPPVFCHIGEINQVFLNLIVNAAHAIADVVQGTDRKGLIRVRTRNEGDWVAIRIEDTGCGIPKEVQGRVFDPFFTTKEVGKGSGQGLAIARSIVVDKHGGRLTLESEVGKGTSFIIRLPVTEGDLPRTGDSK
jgi:two-component system, NtrC family, sensor kinase